MPRLKQTSNRIEIDPRRDAASAGAIVMDCHGTVQHCHEALAQLFHARPRALVGRHIRELIPQLPLNPATPGYNAAYATFWAPKGQRSGFHGVDSQGREFGLRVALIGPKLRAWRERLRAGHDGNAASAAQQEFLYCLCQPD